MVNTANIKIMRSLSSIAHWYVAAEKIRRSFEFVDIEVAIAIHNDLAVQIPDFSLEVGDLGFYESIQGFGVAIRLKPWHKSIAIVN